jgi:hypothetical protein
MPPIDDDLDDPAHDAMRGELARLFVMHKADLGVGHFSDAEIVARVDDIAALMLARHGRARATTRGWRASHGSATPATGSRSDRRL